MTVRASIYEVFDSIAGEGGGVAPLSWTTFVRFAGCNLSCGYCDQAPARDTEAGTVVDVDKLAKAMGGRASPRHVLMTGGEPMLQAEALQHLCTILKRNTGRTITVETNGTRDLAQLDRAAVVDFWVVDYKLSERGEGVDCHQAFVNPPINGRVVIKFIVGSVEDYNRVMTKSIPWIKSQRVSGMRHVRYLLSPVMGQSNKFTPADLFRLMRHDMTWRRNVELSVQVHKLADLAGAEVDGTKYYPVLSKLAPPAQSA